MSPLLTLQELCQVLKVSRMSIYRWMDKDSLPYLKLGRCLRFREKDIERWLARKSRKRKKIEI